MTPTDDNAGGANRRFLKLPFKEVPPPSNFPHVRDATDDADHAVSGYAQAGIQRDKVGSEARWGDEELAGSRL